MRALRNFPCKTKLTNGHLSPHNPPPLPTHGFASSARRAARTRGLRALKPARPQACRLGPGPQACTSQVSTCDGCGFQKKGTPKGQNGTKSSRLRAREKLAKEIEATTADPLHIASKPAPNKKQATAMLPTCETQQSTASFVSQVVACPSANSARAHSSTCIQTLSTIVSAIRKGCWPRP